MGVRWWWSSLAVDEVARWSLPGDASAACDAVDAVLSRSWYRCRRFGSTIELRWKTRFGQPPVGVVTVQRDGTDALITITVPTYLVRQLVFAAVIVLVGIVSLFRAMSETRTYPDTLSGAEGLVVGSGFFLVVIALSVAIGPIARRWAARRIGRVIARTGATYLAPAGWYPDPEGPTERWWDGTRWTDTRAGSGGD